MEEKNMIENEELGLKIAEHPEEQLWIRVRDNTKQRITELENTILVEKALLEAAEKKLEAWKK
jgi:hypothetical protein